LANSTAISDKIYIKSFKNNELRGWAKIAEVLVGAVDFAGLQNITRSAMVLIQMPRRMDWKLLTLVVSVFKGRGLWGR
jgi:hypothetical protein